jgi:hypothetical protein
VEALLRKRLRKFYVSPRVGNWEKVMKRYLTLGGKIRSRYLEKHVPELLHLYPGIRESCFNYYASLGYSPKRLRHLLEYLKEQCLDDASWFQAAKVLVEWQLPSRSVSRLKIRRLANPTHIKNIGSMAASIWLLAKYGSSVDLEQFISQTIPRWSKSVYLSRQVAASSARMNTTGAATVKSALVARGLTDGLRVYNHLEMIKSMKSLDIQLKSYLFYPPTAGANYPFPKVLTGLSLLKGSMPAVQKKSLQNRLLSLTTDAVHKEILKSVVI